MTWLDDYIRAYRRFLSEIPAERLDDARLDQEIQALVVKRMGSTPAGRSLTLQGLLGKTHDELVELGLGTLVE